ncbi:MAG: VWA domain-containing protein [Planctomycetales bacterium]|nr:VWA domain-containing protein [Planctomycetales bacterium]
MDITFSTATEHREAETGVHDAAISDERIERQLARARRWRRSSWPAKRTILRSPIPEPIRVDQPLLPMILYGGSRPATWSDFFRSAYPYLIFSGLLHIACLLWLASVLVQPEAEEEQFYLQAIPDKPMPEPIEAPPLIVALPSVVDGGDQVVSFHVSSVVAPPDLGGAQPSVAPSAPSSTINSGPIGDVKNLAGNLGQELSAAGGEGRGAEFFGIRAGGEKFVFVVDSSRSMTGQRWQQASRELLASIQRLDEDMLFYVIFFDETAHPMFDRDLPEEAMLAATPANIERLREWIASMPFGQDTKPLKSMRLALDLRPDAIYLLSDGEFADQTATYLRHNNMVNENDRLKMPGVVVHTIGFQAAEGQAVLKRIASENGGLCQMVKHDGA